MEICGLDLQTAYDLYQQHRCNLQVCSITSRPQSATNWDSSLPIESLINKAIE
jgi:hypothetical protein